MFVSRHLVLPVSLLVLGAVAIGCTGSEPYVPPTATGSGGTIAGTGGAMSGSGGSGSGGTVGGSGGTVGGSGGMVAGSGGSMADAAPVDRPRDTVTMETAMEAGGMLTFAKDISPILTRVCGGCHGAGAAGGMQVGMLSSVTGMVSTAHAACSKVDATSKKRIVPMMPDKSYLYAKITMTTAQLGAGCGNAMPASGMLTAAEKAMIGNWITQGAM
ncbi:MAG: hypothetical protein QOI66_4766 [Myxococcales bacterium]|jgi:hypothetical protein|nr:hypothetical protein [Myxococcales bacterium]